MREQTSFDNIDSHYHNELCEFSLEKDERFLGTTACHISQPNELRLDSDSPGIAFGYCHQNPAAFTLVYDRKEKK